MKQQKSQRQKKGRKKKEMETSGTEKKPNKIGEIPGKNSVKPSKTLSFPL